MGEDEWYNAGNEGDEERSRRGTTGTQPAQTDDYNTTTNLPAKGTRPMAGKNQRPTMYTMPPHT